VARPGGRGIATEVAPTATVAMPTGLIGGLVGGDLSPMAGPGGGFIATEVAPTATVAMPTGLMGSLWEGIYPRWQGPVAGSSRLTSLPPLPGPGRLA